MKKQSVVIRFMNDCSPEVRILWETRTYGVTHPVWAEAVWDFFEMQPTSGVHGYDNPFRVRIGRGDLNRHLKKFRVKTTVVPIEPPKGE